MFRFPCSYGSRHYIFGGNVYAPRDSKNPYVHQQHANSFLCSINLMIRTYLLFLNLYSRASFSSSLCLDKEEKKIKKKTFAHM